MPTFTIQQLQALKTDILANSDTAALIAGTNPDNSDQNQKVADLYNTVVPSFILWKSMVTIREIGQAFDPAELAARVSADQQRLQTLAMYFASGVNPSLAGIRAFFDDIFSGAGGITTRTINLPALWRRSALRGEKLFATGTGNTATPATLVTEGKLTNQDIANSRNSS